MAALFIYTLNADISPLGLFCIIIMAVILLVMGLLFSELMRLRHELHHMREKLERGVDVNLETTNVRGILKHKIYFKNLTPDELRN